MTGIISGGAYLPLLRLQRSAIAKTNAWCDPSLNGLARGERSMCNWDEDTITMATESVQDLLPAAGEVPTTLLLASTSHPFRDRQNAGVVSEALSLGSATLTMDVGGSLRSGTSALISALGICKGNSASALVVGSEHRRTAVGTPQEMLYGDGSAALLVGDDDIALDFIGSCTQTTDFVDRYHGADSEFEYSWEDRWVRDEGYFKIIPSTVKQLLEQQQIDPASINHLIVPCPNAAISAGIGQRLGINPEALAEGFHQTVGHTGSALSLLMLVYTMEHAKPGDLILVCGFGQGCDALLFRATDLINQSVPGLGVSGNLKRRVEEPLYSKFQAFNGLLHRDTGKRSESDKQTSLTTLYRNKDFFTRFHAKECTGCGTIQFPTSALCVNPECAGDQPMTNTPMANIPGKVVTWTADRLIYDLSPPAYFGMIEFDNGARLMMDFTDMSGREVTTNDPVSVHFRIKQFDEQRGFRKYFWKAIPDQNEEVSS